MPLIGLAGRLLASGIAEALIEEGMEKLGEKFEDITVPVNSSCIRSIGWKSGDIITVDFIRGGEYHYEGDKAMFQAFVAAPSKGAFFNAHFGR
jgi:hypothetical protein